MQYVIQNQYGSMAKKCKPAVNCIKVIAQLTSYLKQTQTKL